MVDGGSPPPLPPPPAGGAAPGHPDWWQHWQVVLVFVVGAFAAGMATGLMMWIALDDDGGAISADDGGFPEAVADDRPPLGHGALGRDTSDVTLPEAALSVASDGCGVMRSDMESDPHGLQWSILDDQGFQVLARNALGETRYRFFRPGSYTVVLKAWDGEKYAPISNTVTIDC